MRSTFSPFAPHSVDRAKLRFISFDADQTLFDFRRTLREALEEVAKLITDRSGRSVSASQLTNERDHIAAKHADAAVPMLVLREQSFATVLKGHRDCRQIVNVAMDLFKRVRFGRTYLFPGVEQTLQELSDRYKLILLTNGNSDPDRSPLRGIFDHIILGEDYPFKKPDARLFHAMWDRANVSSPNEICHVGDRLDNDVGGANSVGCASVWFNPKNAENHTEILPPYEIKQMAELQELL